MNQEFGFREVKSETPNTYPTKGGNWINESKMWGHKQTFLLFGWPIDIWKDAQHH